MKDIVLCYAKEDKKIARKLLTKLEGNSIKCWIDSRDQSINLPKENSLKEAIEGAEIFILLLSQFSEKSEDTIKSLQIAIENKIPIIPFKIGKLNNSLPTQYMLGTLDWIDAFEDTFEEAYEILLEIIEEITQGKVTPKTVSERQIKKKPNPAKKAETQNKNNCLIAVITGVIILAGLLFYFKGNQTNKANSTTNLGNIENTINNNNTQKNAVVPTQHNIHEKVPSVAGQPLIGVWKISEYTDNRKNTVAQRKTILENIEALKKVAVVIYRPDKSFLRAGFSKLPQKGTWELNAPNRKILLTPEGSTQKETINLITLNDTIMKIVVIELQPNSAGKSETVTTQITFTKQK